MDPGKKLRIIFGLAAAAVFLIIILVVAQVITVLRRDKPNTQAADGQQLATSEQPVEEEDDTSVLDWFDSFFEPDNSSSQITPPVSYDFDPFATPPAPSGSTPPPPGTTPPNAPLPPPAKPLPSANVTSPSLGQILTIGETSQIRWTLSSEIKDVRVKIFESPVAICGYDKNCAAEIRSRTPSYTIAGGESNDGVFSWKIGNAESATIPAGKYYIRIETMDGNVLGSSQTFAVASQSNSAIDLVIPYDVSSFAYEADPMPYFSEDVPQGVLWNASPVIFYVDIFIKSKSSSQSFQIAKHEPNGNLFGWKPGKGSVDGKQIPSGAYELYVQDADDQNIKSQTRSFILNPTDE